MAQGVGPEFKPQNLKKEPQEDLEFQASLGYIVRSCLKNKINKAKQKKKKKKENVVSSAFKGLLFQYGKCTQPRGAGAKQYKFPDVCL
jgi:hypothetical protein